MSLNIDTFRSLVDQTRYGNRDIVVSGEGKNATARLGNYFFSQGKAVNNATMKAFKEALEKEYGALGTHAFDTVLGARSQLNKSLRACDIQQTLSSLVPIRENRFLGEVNRPGTYTIDDERITIFQALALAGDMTLFSKRNEVQLLREGADGKLGINKLDLTSADITTSPFYYMQQNDVLYVRPTKNKVHSSIFNSNSTMWTSLVSAAISIASLFIIVYY